MPEYSKLNLNSDESCCCIMSDKNCKADFIDGWGKEARVSKLMK